MKGLFGKVLQYFIQIILYDCGEESFARFTQSDVDWKQGKYACMQRYSLVIKVLFIVRLILISTYGKDKIWLDTKQLKNFIFIST